MDAPGEIFDIAARDAALDALIEDALFDGDDPVSYTHLTLPTTPYV